MEVKIALWKRRFPSLYHRPSKHGEDLKQQETKIPTVRSERPNRDSKPTHEIIRGQARQ